MTIKGPVGKQSRTIDTSHLATWFALRAVEQQANRLEAIEAERQKAEQAEAEKPVSSTPPATVPLGIGTPQFELAPPLPLGRFIPHAPGARAAPRNENNTPARPVRRAAEPAHPRVGTPLDLSIGAQN
jgi:hypothetical protein